MGPEALYCWNCGKALSGIPQPLGRRAECPACMASLRVCRQCEFYDTTASKDCREPMVDEIVEKEAANFCDYFRPKGGPPDREGEQAGAARAKLAALFGKQDDGSTATGGNGLKSEAEAARQKLEDLFGKKED